MYVNKANDDWHFSHSVYHIILFYTCNHNMKLNILFKLLNIRNLLHIFVVSIYTLSKWQHNQKTRKETCITVFTPLNMRTWSRQKKYKIKLRNSFYSNIIRLTLDSNFIYSIALISMSLSGHFSFVIFL